MRPVVVLALCLFSISARCEITYTLGERIVKKEKLEEFEKAAPAKTIEANDPHENRHIKYDAVSLIDTLDRVYGSSWKAADFVYLVSRDGYASPISTSDLDEGFLAYARLNSAGERTAFVVNNREQNEKRVSLAPLYLVWSLQKSADFLAEGSINWPYQIQRIELWNANEKFKKSLPGAGAAPAVRNGFMLFQKYCVACHSLYHEGGSKGGELAVWLQVDAHDDSWLKTWIANPQVIDPKSKMPPLNLHLKNRDEAIENLVSYLKAVVKKS